MHPDRRLALGLFAISAAYLAAATAIAAPEGGYATVGPRAFPLAIGIGLAAVALRIGIRPEPLGDPAPGADWRAAGPSVVCFLLYAVLLEPAGYLPATTAFIAVEARLLGSRRWRRDLAASVLVAASIYVLFGSLLGIRLPAGILGGW
ncbi:MAG: tripartite tricarboxylate transporter TctB family protein [Acidobacteria bacterium]|nr:tripartite tricarboxylate transporter TctB family protein [Acidobacteriota bacterium]